MKHQHPDKQGTSQHAGVMRNLGGFVGGILAGIKAKPGTSHRTGTRAAAAPQTVASRASTQSTTGTTEDGRAVTLRRTVIEEIEIHPSADGDATQQQSRPPTS